jgi:2,4-dienoyl-CoA reductase-like NADH-dependent reductase (Old Yellow Enzyme family)
VIAVHEPELDNRAGVDPGKPVITDAELRVLEDEFVAAARLASQAGFDAVDIKACHRYLISELLGAHDRPGEYGGSYENRTRWLKNVITKIKDAKIGIEITTRLNAYDAIPYPYGWGCDSEGGIDLTEPKRLVRELAGLGLTMINITIATPYLKPHISRPYDQPGRNGYPQPEHPIIGIARILNVVKEMQKAVPDCVIVGTGFSWLRQFAPYVAAGMVKEGWASICGFGRGGFAYPDFANDIFTAGEMSPRKVCISCSKCSELKGAARLTGCVVRDSKVYAPIYQKFLEETAGK